MELLTGISELFGETADQLVWRVDPGLKQQAIGSFEEERTIARAVNKRVHEFRSGRNLARAALAALGVPVASLPSGLHGMPVWPDGTAGSISHTDRFAVAVVGWQYHFAGLGIDVENAEPLDPNLLGLVMTTADRQFVHTQDKVLQYHWAKTVFSAKEAFYKAIFPSIRKPLDFTDAAIRPLSPLDADSGAFEVLATSKRMAEFGLCAYVSGRWLRHGVYVFCFSYLPPWCENAVSLRG